MNTERLEGLLANLLDQTFGTLEVAPFVKLFRFKTETGSRMNFDELDIEITLGEDSESYKLKERDPYELIGEIVTIVDKAFKEFSKNFEKAIYLDTLPMKGAKVK